MRVDHFLGILFLSATGVAQPLLHRIAGPGPNDRVVMDDKPATSVTLTNIPSAQGVLTRLSRPVAVTVDANGRLLFALDRTILRLYEDGLLKVLAGGNGQGVGVAGDEVASTSALISQLTGQIASDAAGNVYYADTYAETVRMVKLDGLVRTVAHVAGVSGVVVDNAGRLYAYGTNLVRIFPNGFTVALTPDLLKVPPPIPLGGLPQAITGAAANAQGDIYIAESGTPRVRRIAPDGRVVSTTAVGFLPTGVAVDNTGHVYVSDAARHQIWRFNEGGAGIVIAGGSQGYTGDGGPATRATLNAPTALALDSSGALYIADTNNDVIRKITTAGTISTVAGNGPPRFGYAPCVSDLTYQLAGVPEIYTGDGGPGTTALLAGPISLAFAPDGNLLIGTIVRVRKMNPDLTITTVAGNGTFCEGGDASDARKVGVPDQVITTDRQGRIYATGQSDRRIRRIDPNGSVTVIAGLPNALAFPTDPVPDGPALQAKFTNPTGLDVDSKANVYVADTGLGRVRVVTPDGLIRTIAGSATRVFGGDPRALEGVRVSDAKWDQITGVAVDRDDRLYISAAFGSNGAVYRVEDTGTLHLIAGGGTYPPDEVPANQANVPIVRSLYYDRDTGDFYLNGDAQSWQITNDGTIHWVAGTGKLSLVQPSTGQGRTPRETDLTSPFVVPGPDSLYISDFATGTVLRAYPTPPQVTVTTGYQMFLTAGPGSPVAQAVVEVLSTALLPYSVQATAHDGGRWFRADVVEGILPARFIITADASNLKPGTYAASVHITAPGSLPPVQTIRVTLTVTK